MKGLQIHNSDIILEQGDFKLIPDILTAVERLLTTNKSEFMLNLNMGLDYDIIRRKRYGYHATVRRGLHTADGRRSER